MFGNVVRGIAVIGFIVLLTYLGLNRSRHAILGHTAEASELGIAIIFVFVATGMVIAKSARRKFFVVSIASFGVVILAYFLFGQFYFDETNTMDGKSFTQAYSLYFDFRNFLLPLSMVFGILTVVIQSQRNSGRDKTNG